MEYEKIFTALNDALSQKDYSIAYYREQHEKLHDENEQLRKENEQLRAQLAAVERFVEARTEAAQ